MDTLPVLPARRDMRKSTPRIAVLLRQPALWVALAACCTAPARAESMPPGAMVWMVHESNVCWDHITPGGSSLCAASDEFGATGGIPMQTYHYATSWATSFAQAFPDSAHTYLAGYDAGFMFVSMRDVYTVHGAAGEPFAITARLSIGGVANSIWVANAGKYFLVNPYATAEIGSFNGTTGTLLEGDRVTPYSPATTATWSFGTAIGAAVSVPFEVATSYTRLVQAGDAFEIGYGANTVVGVGEIDARHTAVISFDLPTGVWLTSQNGAIFGTPVPEPSARLLAGAGLLFLVLVRRFARSRP